MPADAKTGSGGLLRANSTKKADRVPCLRRADPCHLDHGFGAVDRAELAELRTVIAQVHQLADQRRAAAARAGSILIGRHRAHGSRFAATGSDPAPGRTLRAMAQTIAVLSQKGGTGKTTTVRTLTDAFRRGGLKVLAIDLDPQGNLSDYFDVDPDASPTIAEVLLERASAADAIHEDLIPANLGLAEAELVLGGKMGRELTLRRALGGVGDDYDLLLIDCPPALGLLTVNALVAADHALISAEAQYFAMQGVEQALEVIELARDGLNPTLAWLGVILNIADLRTVHSREARTALLEHVGDRLIDPPVRASIAYAESAERGSSILDHRPDLGADYLTIAAEIATRLSLPDASGRISDLIEGTA